MTFGEKIRELLAERGISLRALAEMASYNAGYLSQVSRDLRPPSIQMAEQLEAALEAPGVLVPLVPPRKARRRGRVSINHTEDLLDLGSAFPQESPTFEGPVAPELVMYFLEQLPGHYKADMWLGPCHLIPTVTTQAQLIDQLTRSADSTIRRGLLGAGVAYAALLGWLHQDAGDFPRSAQWRRIALDMAHRSGDVQLISYALTNKAMLAVDLGDGRAVLDYAEAALAGESKLCPKVRLLALVHQAHGHAFLGDRDAVDAALDRATALVDQVDDEHPWGNACRRTPRYIDVQRATAYVRLGAHCEAVSMWEGILGSAPISARRDNGVFWTRQAAALAAVPEPDRVVEIAAATAGVVSDTGSARLRRELLTLPRRAAQWSGTRAGRELGEIIAGIA